MMADLRPFRVWNADRSVKKAITAASLQQLLDKGRDKLGYRECVTAVLEADGTEVDEDDYFRFLEDHTTFILLRETDQWTSSQHAVSESSSGEDSDVVDASTAYRPTVERLQLTGAAPATRDRSLAQLSRTLRKDFTQIVTFSRNELQCLVDASEADLGRLLARRPRDVAQVQLCCQRHLDEKRDNDDALQFVRLLRGSTAQSDNHPVAGKRRRPTP